MNMRIKTLRYGFFVSFEETTGEGSGLCTVLSTGERRPFRILGLHDERAPKSFGFTTLCFEGGPEGMGGLRVYGDIAKWHQDPASIPL